MFSATGYWQELVALVIAGIAGGYVAFKMFGWPSRKKTAGPNVVLGSRLARGLDRSTRSRPTPPSKH